MFFFLICDVMYIFTAFVYEAWRRTYICWPIRPQFLQANWILWGIFFSFLKFIVVLVISLVLAKMVISLCLNKSPWLFRQFLEYLRSRMVIILLHGCLRWLILWWKIVLVWTLQIIIGSLNFPSTCSFSKIIDVFFLNLHFILILLVLHVSDRIEI